jgi:hypothetical protein
LQQGRTIEYSHGVLLAVLDFVSSVLNELANVAVSNSEIEWVVTSACASASGLSRTMATSISPLLKTG